MFVWTDPQILNILVKDREKENGRKGEREARSENLSAPYPAYNCQSHAQGGCKFEVAQN